MAIFTLGNTADLSEQFMLGIARQAHLQTPLGQAQYDAVERIQAEDRRLDVDGFAPDVKSEFARGSGAVAVPLPGEAYGEPGQNELSGAARYKVAGSSRLREATEKCARSRKDTSSPNDTSISRDLISLQQLQQNSDILSDT
ncbi:Cytochrome P450 monooygenase 2 [Diaporthe amygdali]|uniref:Cytochrome P450 monooygenase 2 n=1 Tax=Phomopsis amygdali TaxID=1214568 RepID=UPI0022FF025E|nr:Cytochrome P450 monooygenase 2 [Diaporthe amygdali]KAJ0123676.1 Cytochrome P450 monooygenase 2 [Diaporthe amygdali]